ncbi:hypothetical protein QBC43DRAFT_325057 [Cladorrhinum sp. PSN259]|nr:hypothetical protein QBC43DRAFT_325057 [Cladorrhinum sp. PSN259]
MAVFLHFVLQLPYMLLVLLVLLVLVMMFFLACLGPCFCVGSWYLLSIYLGQNLIFVGNSSESMYEVVA